MTDHTDFAAHCSSILRDTAEPMNRWVWACDFKDALQRSSNPEGRTAWEFICLLEDQHRTDQPELSADHVTDEAVIQFLAEIFWPEINTNCHLVDDVPVNATSQETRVLVDARLLVPSFLDESELPDRSTQ